MRKMSWSSCAGPAPGPAFRRSRNVRLRFEGADPGMKAPAAVTDIGRRSARKSAPSAPTSPVSPCPGPPGCAGWDSITRRGEARSRAWAGAASTSMGRGRTSTIRIECRTCCAYHPAGTARLWSSATAPRQWRSGWTWSSGSVRAISGGSFMKLRIDSCPMSPSIRDGAGPSSPSTRPRSTPTASSRRS